MDPITPQEPFQPTAHINTVLAEPSASSFHYAGFWPRLVALIIDGLVLTALNSLLSQLFTAWSEMPNVYFWFFYIGPSSFLGNVYNVVFTGWNGQTIGKSIMGIKVVTLSGGQVSWIQAIIRELMKFVSAVVILLGYFWMLWDKDQQTWHDKVSGTYVIKLK